MLILTRTHTMGRFTIAGSKNCRFHKKNQRRPSNRFSGFTGVFDGVGEDVGCWTWFFDGEIVVECVVNVV